MDQSKDNLITGSIAFVGVGLAIALIILGIHRLYIIPKYCKQLTPECKKVRKGVWLSVLMVIVGFIMLLLGGSIVYDITLQVQEALV